MSNNLKHLKEQIEKYADEFDLPPSRPSHAAGVGGQLAGQTGMQPPHRGGPAKPGGGGVPQGNLINDVIKMQDQLINLANTVVKESGPFNVTPQQQQQTGAPPPGGDQRAMSRTSFADFVAQYYARQSDVPAVEFTPDPTKNKPQDLKNPQQATRMNTLMDTMRRIGGSQNTASELKTDGRWGPKTNAALKNAYAFAFALIKMAGDFGVKPKFYNDGNLAALKPMIPDEPQDMSDPDKEKYAPEITRHLKGMIKLFQEVKEQILHNSGYQSFIEGDEAFATYKKSGSEKTPQLGPEQVQEMSPWIYKLFPNGFSVPLVNTGTQVQNGTFTLDDLSSKQRFDAKIADLKKGLQGLERDQRVTAQIDPYNVLTNISNQLSQKVKQFQQDAETQAKTPAGVKQYLPEEYTAPGAVGGGR